MLKRALSLGIVFVVAVTALTGCTTDDIALYRALTNEPRSSVETTVTDFDVTVHEPLGIEFYDPDGYYDYDDDIETISANLNYAVDIIGGLLSVSELKTVTKTSDRLSETLTTVTLPDISFSFNGWAEDDAEGRQLRSVYSIPSYIKPMIPAAVGKKEYLLLKAAAAEDDADNPLAPLVSALASAETFVSAMSGAAGGIVTKTERSPEGTVYYVNLDTEAAVACLNALAAAYKGGTLAPPAGLTAENAAEMAENFGKLITETGLLENGLTAKYTVSPAGYVVRSEEEVELTVDVARVVAAILRLAFDYGDFEEDGIDLKGKFTVKITSVSDLTSVNAPVEVNFPALTDENTLDAAKERSEYEAYEDALDDWVRSWYDYSAREAYVEMHQPGDPLILRNAETGAEVTTIPMTRSEIDPDYDEETDGWYYDDVFYIPLSDLAAIFDGVNVSWNDELKGVVMEGVYDQPAIIFNPDGEAMYESLMNDPERIAAAEEAAESDPENFMEVYDEVLNAGTPYLDYMIFYEEEPFMFTGGRYYIDSTFLNSDLGVVTRFEDGKFCYYPESATVYDESYMDGNLYYELDKMILDDILDEILYEIFY